MKRYFFFAFLLLTIGAIAQNQEAESVQETKNLKVKIVNKRGKAVKGSNIFFTTTIENVAVPMGRKGVSFIKTALPDDTLTVATITDILIIPVSALDSLTLCVLNKKHYVVRGDNNYTYDLGYVTVSNNDNAMPVKKLNMRDKGGYADLASYLQGRVAGVQVVSGENAEKVVIIRGINTFHGDVGALVVVDGVVYESFDMANRSVNIRDIKSVDILMDGSLYGIRGSNGVIVVTTQIGVKE